ncbi:MAG TPA: neuraminidase-like domain-containing protein [Methylomusa anaerophila]|uniref:PA14 domain protein n=1 Tax=Methylomusa anaerophila TaxID=1930071 RepID=A0A348ANE3_9FIRM|nr:neuraminidase-like domain-containing protein [Methylomusa anaerophila]BBB92591.1 hypothetical protein MAMMFC1_03286 [Methylomusa anaerophila]HML87555.1 neuraminidase-like domain-containing protein [Methylomusa anaerophila]
MADQIKNLKKIDLKIDFFNLDLKSEKQQKAFERIYKNNNGNWAAVKSELTGEEGFTPAIINDLEFTHRLAEWGKDNKDLISVFKKDDQINSMRDIAAKFNKAAFIEKVKDIARGESEEEKKAFALNLHRELFFLEPTPMLVNMIKDPQVPILNNVIGANVAAVLEKQPDFNIKTTSVYQVLKNEEALQDILPANHETVITELKTLQRITAVSPDTDALPALYNANLHSAMQISAIPQTQFIADLGKSGLDDNTLIQIHTNAQQVRVRNEQAIMALRETYSGTGVAMIDNSLNMAVAVKNKKVPSFLEETLAKHNLSWDLLFGDADFCECDECGSVYSAAAYYVELLQYLRNNNLDPDAGGPTAKKTNPRDISGTPLEKLFDRRPDLGCLELTCENTNTVLPYIDLVNEVMENYVAFKYLKPFNVEDETSGELLAEPQHTEYQAYCILKNEVYPFLLPYHQPIDAERIYLKHLDTSRYELIETFRKNNTDNKDNKDNNAKLTHLKDDALDRAADAEFLGLSMEEYVILTKECFESKELMDKLKNKIHTEDEYRQLIGVKPVCKYYGFDDDNAMLGDEGLTLIKKEFLRRTGIDYFNLVDLLKTGYINPYLPRGKSKTIMESLHFSYRFLQNYAKAYGMDKMAEDLVKGEKLAELVPLLKEQIDLLTDKKALSCPKPNRDEIQISDKDIIHWVKCHFKKVGKMIVIESGRGCVNGKIVRTNQEMINRVTIVVEDCKIFFVNNDHAKTEIGSIDKKTGEVLLKDSQIPIDQGLFKDLSFIGDKGEKGIFLVIDHKIYLVFLEQKDSCDLDTALLQHLDGTPLTVEEYDRIHRFLRLWRKLGWTINETDQAIAGLSQVITQDIKPADSICDLCGEEDCNSEACGGCEENTVTQDFDINPNLIHQLAAVKKLLDKTGLELIKLLAFWSDISTAGEKSLYQRLFLTHNVLGIDKIFKVDDKGNYLTGNAKLLEHVPVVMAALNLSADDIQEIMKAAGMEDKLTLSNLSILYRYRLLSKVLGLKIPAFVSILPLYGNIFQDAQASLEFLNRWEKMESAGFTHQQLNYIIKDADDEKKPFAPSQKDILQLSKTLYDGLNAIDEEHKDLKADDTITDPALQKINIQEQATGALIRTKASLLFETGIVEKIIGILEGTNVFTTNAPKNLDFTFPDTNTLKNKLKYDKTLGIIQITGILTEAEAADYQAVNNSPDWVKALTRIQKQQDKLFKELLSGIFENEQTKTGVEKTQLEAIIKAGDMIIPLDQIPEGEADPNTAPLKRAAFLEIFLPYLRQQLSHRFVIDTLANFTGVEGKITDVLVSEVLKLGTPATPIYSIFAKVKESAKPEETNWSGYLIPAADAGYTFIIKNSDTKPTVSIDGEALDFTAQEDPTNEWWSGTKALQAGKLYKLAATGGELKNIFWKTPAAAITSIPSAALIPDFASGQCKPALIVLKKAAMLISAFDLSADEIRFLDLRKTDFDNLDFNAPTLTQWLRLEAFIRLRNSLPQAKLNLLEFGNWVYKAAADETELIEKIADLTTWNKERIKKLIAADHFNIGKLADYRNEKNLLKLQEALSVADKIGIDIDLLFQWAVPVSKFNTCRKIAASIKNAIRAKYNQTDWEQVVKPLHDQLRNNQKEALIGYLLQQKELIAWNVTDADGLFEYFLIDVQMDACMETSRIKQAISSVQLFVQRCFLGLEEEHNGIKPNALDRSRWDWMQRYRVWEANRKVFLYPENWIESNLRDDKSPFFKELESELLQKDINKQNVTDALKSYLYKVDEVANMEVVGLYIVGTRTGTQWSKDAKLHIFSRTRNAPYIFYYRYLALDEMNWYPWEKMQIDIPSYDVEDPNTHEVKDNGCYLTPAVWNGRLLVFFPQIMKKTKPNSASNTGSFNSLGNDSDGIGKSKPIDYYEIKMAWSEYRNGKWTQKQLSKDAVFSQPIDDKHDIQFFKFIPIVYTDKVVIDVDDYLDSDGGYKGAFEFNGTALKVRAVINTEPIPINYFNQDDGNLYSWQIDSSSFQRQNEDVYFYEDSAREQVQGLNPVQTKFNDPNTQNLLGKMNLGQLEGFFKENLSMPANNFGPFDQDDNSATPNIYHELKQPYSLYNWELFFHTPILLADALSKAQQFEEAMKWFHFVFNPIADGNEDNRFWQFKPFKSINSQRVLDSIFNNLKPNTADKTINEWRNKPFMPHVVARSRPVAYMKWVVMKYIDNLLAWGDYLFRQDTIETINQATQLYVLAGHILGPQPMMIPKRGTIKPQTYLGLLDKWDAFGNAMVELELTAPFSNQTTLPFGTVNNELAFANIYGLASSLYFCIPNNPKLMGYWDTLADRLYKIRHCQNIEGVFRKLPLFEPPIDPALLVKAAAQGLSIASVLNDLNAPMPNYRFYFLLQKALELCTELKSLGGAMLLAIEKKDNETIALIRAKHEGVMQNLVMEIKKKQLEEAQKNIESLLQNRKTPEARMKYYLKLSGLDESLVPADTADFNGLPNEIVTVDGDGGLKLIPFEKEDMEKASEAADWQEAIGVTETIASILNIIPSLGGYVTPIGVGATATWGGSNLGSAASAVARGMQTHSAKLTFQSAQAGKKGGFTRALQERIFQANAAGYELKQIDRQITAQQIRIDIANQEITNQQKAIDNATEVEEFIKNKYSSEELYTWMRGSLKTLYHQVYNLAYELAKKAEKTYCFERGLSNANFIQPGYFDAGRDGLLAGEQLYVGLKQLEAAYQNERGHDYEITKQISIYQINPLAVIQLRETGKCEFVLPEVLFDMDYPGHYKRRIKAATVSIPCIAGPYTGINATLSLLENKFRNTAIGGKNYEEDSEETDDRFSSYAIPIKAIAASSAQNDSGMFELNFRDERYLPFEGAGVISKWRLELPQFTQFDYHSISDVIIHLQYTACEGGERLKAAAAKSLAKWLKTVDEELNESGLQVALNMKHDLPNEWLLLKNNGSVDLKIDKSRLPYMSQPFDAVIENVMFLAKVKDNPVAFSVKVDGEATNLDRIDAWKLCRGNNSDIILNKSFALSVDPQPLDDLEELMIVVKWSLKYNG